MPEVTQVDVEQLTGRELDAAVAERVMDLSVEWVGGDPRYRNEEMAAEYGGQWTSPVPCYSELIEVAMRVVKKLQDRFAFDMGTWKTPAFTGWHVKLWTNGEIAGEARSEFLEQAICRAALKALEQEK